ncbi:unnamed protein product [Hyaloperonospora brassicae]|uniref:RxLR effector candidate protein n=1 Tax=Hyaloperonospora brassicae TaxID=162125 RepID=A0AAV0UUV6_HYABA|nr:unnamed protein product [Hyaloperonospora brassicae]
MRIHATEIVAVVAITTGILSVSDAFSFPTTAVDVGDTVFARIRDIDDKVDCLSLIEHVGGFIKSIFSKAHPSIPVLDRTRKLYEKNKWIGMNGPDKVRRAEAEELTKESMMKFRDQGASPSLKHVADFVEKSPGSGFVAAYAERLKLSKREPTATFGRTILEHLPHVWLKKGLSADGVFHELQFEFGRLDFIKLTLLEEFIKLSNAERSGDDTLMKTLLKFYGDYDLHNLLASYVTKSGTKKTANQRLRELRADWAERSITIDDVEMG